MAAISTNKFPSVTLEEVASDGSTVTNPAADHRKLFLGEDGLLHLRDSAGGVTTPGAAASAVSFDATGLGNTSATEVQTALEDYDAAISAASGGAGVGTPVRVFAPATDLSTASGTDVAVSSAMDIVVTVGSSGVLMLIGCLTLKMGAVTADCQLTASIDGGSTKQACGGAGWDGAANQRKAAPINWVWTGVTPGSTTIKLYWLTTGGNTVTLDGASRGSAQQGSWAVGIPL